MKRCPECGRDYNDDSMSYCLDDGSELLFGPASADEPATAILSEPPALADGQFDDGLRTAILHESAPRSEAATNAQIQTTNQADSSGLDISKSYLSQEVRRHKFAAGAIVIFGIVVLVGFGYGLYKFLTGSVESPDTQKAKPIVTQRLTGDGKARDAVISPDGKFLAYIKVSGAERSIWLKQILTNSNIEIAKPGELNGYDGLEFSPDGNFLYFNALTRTDEAVAIYRVPTIGGTPTKAFTNAYAVGFSADGKKVSFVRSDFESSATWIVVANVDGSDERILASKTGTEFFDGAPAWSPDGKLVAISTGNDAVAPSPLVSVAIVSTADSTITELGTTKFFEIDDFVWHPSGDSLIVVAKDTALTQRQIGEISYPGGSFRRITNDLTDYGSISITSDGKSLVTGELYSKSAIWVSPDLKPENAKPVMPNTGDTWGFGWTHDNRIVYVSNQSGDAEIWIMDADGSNAKALTNNRKFKTTPVASPDGKYVVYTDASRGGELVRIDLNGGNELLLTKTAGAGNPDISLDGRWVIYSGYVEGRQKILRVSIDGGDPTIIADYWATEPRYSRDGTRFACFIPNEKTQAWTRLAIVPAAGGSPTKVFDVPQYVNLGRGPIWTPDDKGITLVIAQGEFQNLWLQPVDGGAGKQMTDFPLPGIARRDYSRDGKRIALVRGEGIGNAIMITEFR